MEDFDRLVHELAEALTAAGALLRGCEHIMADGDAADHARVRQAISHALAQTDRASLVIGRLRSTADQVRELSKGF